MQLGRGTGVGSLRKPLSLAVAVALVSWLAQARAQAPGPARSYDALAAEYRHAPSPALLFQLGKAAAADGKMAEAQDLLRRFLADSEVDASDPNVAEAQRISDGAHGPRGEVNVVGDPKSVVLVDGRVAAVLPIPVPLLLSAGSHQIVVERGRRKLAAPVKVLDGRQTELLFNLDSDTVLVTQPPAVVVLPELRGVPESTSGRLIQAAEQAVRHSNLAVFNAKTAQERAADTVGCLQTPRCQARLGERNQVEYVLTIQVRSAGAAEGPPSSYELQLLLLDVSVQDYAARASTTLAAPAAGSASLSQSLAKELGSAIEALLHEALVRARGTLVITSQPPGAEVVIGGQTLGRTPYKHPAWVGPVEVTLNLEGYVSEKLAATVADKSEASYAVTLQRVPALPPKRIAGRPRGRFVGGLVSAAGGVLLIGFGGSALSVDRQCDPAVDPTQPCGYLYDTPVVGGTLIGVGGALLLTGTILMAVPAR